MGNSEAVALGIPEGPRRWKQQNLLSDGMGFMGQMRKNNKRSSDWAGAGLSISDEIPVGHQEPQAGGKVKFRHRVRDTG